MANGHLGTRGAQPGRLLLGWIPSTEEYTLAIGLPTLYYRLEEPIGSTTVADYSGNYPGSYNGIVTLNQLGPSGGAVLFANGAYANSVSSSINVGTGSISFWSKLSAYPSSNFLLLGCVNSSSVSDKTFVLSPTGLLTFTINGTTISAPNIPLGRWNHFVATFDGTNCKLYVNAALISIVAATSSVIGNSTLYVGSPSSTISSYYDEVAIWSNIYPSQPQVTGLYNAGISTLLATGARVTSLAPEIVVANNPNIRLTTLANEVVVAKQPNARLTTLAIEVVRDPRSINGINQTLSFTQTVAANRVGGTTYVESVNQSLMFTQNAIGAVQGHYYAESLTQTLAFTQNTTDYNGGKGAHQTLTFIQTVNANFVHVRSILQAVNFVDTAAIGGTHHQTITQLFSLNQYAAIPKYVQTLQVLTFTQLASPVTSKGATQNLAFSQDVVSQHLVPRSLSQTLVFTQSTKITHPEHISQILAFSQSNNTGFIVYVPNDQGTLGDTDLGDFTLGLDSNTGGPNGFSIDTLGFVQTLALRRVYQRFVTDNLVFRDTVGLGPFVRIQHLTDTLRFLENGSPQTVSVGRGSPYTYTRPTVQATIVRPGVIIQSVRSAIILPSAQFDDNVATNNNLSLFKVMSTKTYTYVKNSDRLTLNYSFLLGRRKSLELRNFYILNVDEYLILTNWKGQIYLVKFGSSPLELTTTGRFENDFESVTVSIQFQGVRVHG